MSDLPLCSNYFVDGCDWIEKVLTFLAGVAWIPLKWAVIALLCCMAVGVVLWGILLMLILVEFACKKCFGIKGFEWLWFVVRYAQTGVPR